MIRKQYIRLTPLFYIQDNFYLDIGLLFALIAAFRIIAFFILLFRAKRSHWEGKFTLCAIRDLKCLLLFSLNRWCFMVFTFHIPNRISILYIISDQGIRQSVFIFIIMYILDYMFFIFNLCCCWILNVLYSEMEYI